MEALINEEEHLCPICLEDILPTEGQALTECCHNVFHLSCIILIYIHRENDKTNCPLCRGCISCKLKENDIESESDTISFNGNLSSPSF